jgi:radical SAM superfamily enzyme YgiQ (UPF0313 family)
MKTIFVGTNSKYIHTALGVRYIRESCRRAGLDAELLEVSVNEPILQVLARLTEAEPAAIGLEVHIWNRSYVLELASLVRKVLPDCLLLAGGPEVLFHPVETLTAAPALDAVVCGEGDEIVPAFLQEVERFQRKHPSWTRQDLLRSVAPSEGFAWRQEDGSIAAPSRPVVVEELDNLPFPYPDLEDVIRDHKILYYESSRGCPFHCAYCLSGITRTVRYRSVPLVLQDLDRMVAAGAALVKFVDRTFNLDESHYLPILEHLAGLDTNATFHFEIKADILTPRVVAFLKTVPKGRFQLEIGVQSTNPDVLAAIGRKDNWVRLQQNVKELLAAGNMHIHMDLIAGLPGEDLASFARSFNDVYALHPQALQLGFLKVLPGTVLARRATEDGLVYMDREPYEVLATRYVSYPEMRFLKVLEEVFDLTYNAERFTFTLPYLAAAGGTQFGAGPADAFAFFRELARWYQQKGCFGVGHTGIDTARLLYDFLQERMPDTAAAGKELLRLDVLRTMPNHKEPWLGWHSRENYERVTAFWRDEERVRRYVPDFTFDNWRNLHKRYAVEEFSLDPWTGRPGTTFLLVDYLKKELTRIRPGDII